MDSPSILDQIMDSQTQNNLTDFQPVDLTQQLLNLLKPRDAEILAKRFGLGNFEVETLESIGKKHMLTRERVRQIEKDSLNFLRKQKSKHLDEGLELIANMIIDHGNIMSENFLIDSVLKTKEEKSKNSLKFLLNLGQQFKYLKEAPGLYPSWHVLGLELKKLQEIIEQFKSILKQESQAITQDQLLEKMKTSAFFKQHQQELNDKVLLSYLNISSDIQINPFDEIGLKTWSDIKPKDVGDKAYLVLKHYGKPEHYAQITKLINDHKFDDRIAFSETVHNELIKDDRFVLVGRGIYALAAWGYKKGVVADVIKEIMKSFNRPLTRDEIINEVLKKRQVKRITILVGLSNRKKFQKVGKDKFIAVENSDSSELQENDTR